MEARLTGIDRSELLRYLRYRGGEIPTGLEDELARCEELLMRTARPRAVWRLFDRLPDGSLACCVYQPRGNDIRALLQDCDQVILMAATLGVEAEMLLRRAQSGSMSEAVILDAAGSAAIENVCDNLCADLAAALQRSCGSSRPCGMTSCLWTTQMDDPAKAVKNNGIIA